MLKIQYFASIREQLNKNEESLILPANVNNVGDLIEYMKNNDPIFYQVYEKNPKLLVAVNHTVADKSVALTRGDEVAFFPPMTGG
jgi:molybdopterin synthase sulfur carrier subunit